ncbi:MAG: MFS transporter [Micavibrio aeruginosavorus]|uniref:MFS transporter n=1 Tax=Micavibrio aeruginosavorus TaxID=349221 RepID=A0A2W5N9P7_9BACT|nr:MAG: MFS transporter [Micavibrio aeruginosavorus]
MSQPEITDDVSPELAPRGAKKSIFAWCVYDWANSAFATVIITFVYSVFFSRNMVGDETQGGAWWSYAIAVSGIFIAILGPFFGAVADHSGARKRWVFGLSMLCIVPSALLWFGQPVAGPANIFFVLALVVIANIGYELSSVFYNAMLTHIAPRHLIGRVSGWGWGVGYLGGLAALAIALFGLIGFGDMEPWFGISGMNDASVRATGPLTAIWFFVFMIPMLIWTHDVERKPMRTRDAMLLGLKQLGRTIREVKHHKNLVQFLVASAIYRDGLNTLFTVGGIYAAGVYKMDYIEILFFAIGLNVTAGLGAFLFAHLDDKIGSKFTVTISLIGLIITGAAVLMTDDKLVFTGLALALGLFMGPAQAASRTLAGRLAPRGMVTQTYGLYAFTGKSVAFMGPLAYGAATHFYNNQSAGMFTIVLFWILGLGLLSLVEEKRED